MTKLKAELPERGAKKQKIEQTFYPSEAHKRLLNVCGFIDFLNPPWFFSLTEVNEFVTNFVTTRFEVEKEHNNNLPYLGICHIWFYFQLFLF